MSKAKERPSAYAPCQHCGADVLTGATASGQRYKLDMAPRTFTVLFYDGADVPTLQESRAYVVHQCGAILNQKVA